LPKALVQREIENVLALGARFEKNVVVGRSVTIDDLFDDGFLAVFVGSGAGLPSFLRIPGENLNGVYSANEFLTRSNLMRAYRFPESPTPLKVGKRVAVFGGGNVAMDAARTAIRLGAEEVSIVYRRSEQELPARLEEVHHAKEEGVVFRLLTNPVALHGKDGWLEEIECLEMELGEPDESGRRRPVPKKDSNFRLPVDTAVVAIGQSPNPLIRQTTPGLDTERWGGIIVDEASLKTSREGVYAGGDVVTGAATVILAMGAGKQAAQAIHQTLSAR
jgi:glutamate synthase (NADPH/NADH) small chain